VIALTLRRDDIGNFWFSLLHELAHVILHRRTGLGAGFFDQFESEGSDTGVDELEVQADSFASNMLVPEERWRRSPARISRTGKVIEKFARELGIHPAIVYGRLRKERNDYTQFAQKIGANTIRKQFAPSGNKEVGDADAAVSSRA
jgi:HTH-type transcriptional regulator/antitoxin HigA